MTTPADGIYNVSHAEYATWEAASFSRLRDLERSPAYCKWAMDNPTERTPAMVRGEAFHALVLEPDTFASRFILKDYDARTKDGKARAEEVKAKGLSALDVATWDAAHKASASLLLHPVARPVLDACPRRERSIITTIDGIRVKGRPDCYGERTIADLKSTKDAMPVDFPRFATQSRVDRQLAFYARLLMNESAFPDSDLWPEAWVLAVNDDAPHEVAAYELSEADLCRAWDEVWPLARAWHVCVKAGAWPTGTENALTFQRAKWDSVKREESIEDIVF